MNLQALNFEPNLRMAFLAAVFSPEKFYVFVINQFLYFCEHNISYHDQLKFQRAIEDCFNSYAIDEYWSYEYSRPEVFLECCKAITDDEIATLKNFYVSDISIRRVQESDYQGLFDFVVDVRTRLNGKNVDNALMRAHFEGARSLLYSRWKRYFSYFVRHEDSHWLLGFVDKDTLSQGWGEFTESYSICTKNSEYEAIRHFFENAEVVASAFNADYIRSWFALYVDFMSTGVNASQLQSFQPRYPTYFALNALHLMAQGQHEAALESMEASLKLEGKRRLFDSSFENFIYAVCLFNNRSNPKIYKRMEGFSKRNLKGVGQDIVKAICYVGTDQDPVSYESANCLTDTDFEIIQALVYKHFGISSSIRYWDFDDISMKGYDFWRYLITLEFGVDDVAQSLQKRFNFQNLLPKVETIEPWERVLDRLLNAPFLNKTKETATGEMREKVVYWVDMESLEIQPRLLKSKDGVEWSKGRAIALSNFKTGTFSSGITDLDRRVIQTLQPTGYYQTYSLSGPQTLFELIGSSNVFRADNPDVEVRIEEETLQIEVKKTANGWRVSHNVPNVRYYNEHQCVSVLGNVIKVLRVKPEQFELITTLNSIDEYPVESQKKLTQVVEKVSSRMLVMGDLVANTTQLNRIEGQSEITFQFTPHESETYRVRALVCPLPQSSLACDPGRGLEYIASQVNGVGVQVKRNLKREKENFAALNDVLAEFDDSLIKTNVWEVDTLGCLRLLEVLRDCPEAKIFWPEGVRLKVSHPRVSAGNIHLGLNRIDQWFELTGHVSIDGKTQVAIAELLQQARQAKGRFIPLGDTEYLAVTDQLKKQLAMLDNIVQSKKNSSTVSIYNAGLIEELEQSGAHIQADEAWQNLSQRIAEAQAYELAVPNQLQAQLRDYQVEGFNWLCRLSQWGAGACLSDDMGLGKTLQTIAMLIARASEGPALVVVPTSLVFNWSSELSRFAPSLSVQIVKTTNRSDLLEQSKAGDIVLVTYGVLSSEIDLFKGKSWATVALDEAHVIKNRETKMAKACRALKSDFRVLLTGTPIQNNLSEIWSLFEFANPGLLGTFKQFTDRFIIPIERDHDKERQRLLKRILSPFILRRTKTEVLDELPQKTEVTLKVSLSEKERALYEHLRLETTTNLDLGEISPIQALAALMKLRQAACHPKLVDPKLNIESSKCERFLSLVEDLKVNGHRALVFSQFTSHLDLIRKELDARNIDYLYLDGAMSATERLRLVDAFQRGNQLLFLISLKAGGTGLNLTAADYVIHLDPWWNPAIESQASDRAYRIGQERPVTIYRLIAENTVEERIIDLHKTKKSLADALMEGGNMANQLSKDEILKLLSQM